MRLPDISWFVYLVSVYCLWLGNMPEAQFFVSAAILCAIWEKK